MVVTSKIALATLFADVGWQYLSQEADVRFTEKHKIGEMMAEDFVNFIYPFVLAGLAYILVRIYEKRNKQKEEDSEGNYIFFSILAGMGGWISGYYFLPMLFEGDYNDFEMGAFAGVGAAVLSMSFNTWYLGLDTLKANRWVTLCMTASFFSAAFCWYMGYMTPEWIMESTGSEPGSATDKWSRGFISEAVTAAGSLLSMAPLMFMKMDKVQSQKNKL